jgi:hypothetical protein
MGQVLKYIRDDAFTIPERRGAKKKTKIKTTHLPFVSSFPVSVRNQTPCLPASAFRGDHRLGPTLYIIQVSHAQTELKTSWKYFSVRAHLLCL